MSTSRHAPPPEPPGHRLRSAPSPGPDPSRVTHAWPRVSGSSRVTSVFKARHACLSWGQAAGSAPDVGTAHPGREARGSVGRGGVSVWALAGPWLSSMASRPRRRATCLEEGALAFGSDRARGGPGAGQGNARELVLAQGCLGLLVDKGEAVRGGRLRRKKVRAKSPHHEHGVAHTFEREQGLPDGPPASEWLTCHSWAGFLHGMGGRRGGAERRFLVGWTHTGSHTLHQGLRGGHWPRPAPLQKGAPPQGE